MEEMEEKRKREGGKNGVRERCEKKEKWGEVEWRGRESEIKREGKRRGGREKGSEGGRDRGRQRRRGEVGKWRRWRRRGNPLKAKHHEKFSWRNLVLL